MREVAELTRSVLVRTVQEWFPDLQPRAQVNIAHPECWTTRGTMTVSNGLSQTPWWRSDPAELGGGLQKSLRKNCFSQGPFAASGWASPPRRLGSSCVRGALPRAVVWFGSPRRNRQGSWGLPLVARRRSLLLAGPAARALEQRGEGLPGQETGEEPSGPGERLQGPLSGRKPRPQGPHNHDSPGPRGEPTA